MFNHSRHPFIAGAIALAMLLGVCTVTRAARATTGGTVQDKEKKEKKDKKDDKDDKKDEIKQSKQEKKYQEIKRFAENLYAKDSEFRDDVEEAFRQKQREHSEYAYSINSRLQADEKLERLFRSSDKSKSYDTLYDNPLVQDYVNRVGHSIVPTASTKLYAFKVTLNPVPEARSLSTGTVYVSSGLLSQIDNEAQLAYILGHEIAHVEKEHWHEDVLVIKGADRWNEQQSRKRNLIGTAITIATVGVAAGKTGSLTSALFAGGEIAAIAPSLLKYVLPDATVTWDKLQEDEADQLGLKYMFDRNYDPREVPKFYASLERTSKRDRRVGLGFMGDTARIGERMNQVAMVLTGFQLGARTGLMIGASNLSERRQAKASMPGPANATDTGKSLDPSRDAAERANKADKSIGGLADLNAKLDSGELIGSTGEFEALMAELKRDNGIRAFEYDMFQMARDNLDESLRIRSNDPQAHLYYGKVLKLTARNASEKSQALGEFVKAIDLDRRSVLPESHLHRALAMMESRDSSQMREIVESLKMYVGVYQREHGGALPPNIAVIYDYMQEANEMTWAARPATNVSTKNIEPINTAAPGARTTEPPVAVPADPPAQKQRVTKKP